MEEKLFALAAIVALVSLAVGPIYWLRPSPRQRQLARLRAHAVKLGLRPEFRQLPQALVQRGYPARMMSYVWTRPEGRWPKEGECWLACVVAGEGGDALQWLPGDRREPPAGLAEASSWPLPPGLAALQADAEGVAGLWHEAGDIGRVDELQRVLAAWAGVYRDAHDSV